MSKGRVSIRLLGAVLAVLIVGGCKPGDERRELQYMPEMYRNPAVKAQEEYPFFRGNMGNVAPPEGTLPRGFERYPYDITEGELAGEELENPLPVTMKNLQLGQKYFNIHCVVCHGTTGAGDGLATIAHRENGMPVPPALYTEKIRDWKDGQLYHTITAGQGQMPGYQDRIEPEHRWAIVHYVRALDLAANPSEGDLEAMERLGWKAETLDKPVRPKTAGEMLKKRSVFPRNSTLGEDN